MIAKRMAAAIVGVAFLAGCAADQQQRPSETVGTLLGAAAGALLGAQVGEGRGRLVGVAVGTLAGAYLGNQIGRTMDDVDRNKMQQTTQGALENNRNGASSSWSNPDTGHSGTVTPVRTYEASADRPCREYTQTVTIDGRTEQVVGTACREPDGTWRIVN
ncbi:MAG: RT0821/Lpp0805 family surface protein [Rhodospirillales bacterium]|nr:RT0821/Lpp0805 family surface protein [Rhodospirillales bacterium]MCW8951179.1 RT0821/Lpp0805 family surface protein [Rhodospirillales bacterium]MCW8970576.1 RT0821/Lpp0805 family surface protein [Rhodospirillales bacterium]MCW9003254.1 RT0821/Lpp0805 family surface protein [Rhodospirillales bacterium]